MAIYPKIRDIKSLPDKRLKVLFENGETKIYDCQPLLKETNFNPLKDDAFFQCVQVAVNGYGVVWNDDIDLSEAELWVNGIEEIIHSKNPKNNNKDNH